MILMGLLWSRIMLCSLECENEMLHQSFVDLSIRCFKFGVSNVKASDTIPLIDDQLTDEVYGLMIVLCCWTVVCYL